MIQFEDVSCLNHLLEITIADFKTKNVYKINSTNLIRNEENKS